MILADSAFNVGSALEVGLPERDVTKALLVPRDAIAVRQTGIYLTASAATTRPNASPSPQPRRRDLVTIDGPVSAGDIGVIRGPASNALQGPAITLLSRDASLRTGRTPDAGIYSSFHLSYR